MKARTIRNAVALYMACALSAAGIDVRIKDVARLAGTETYALVGYGLVVGLAGSGDSDEALSQQTIRNMLENFNVVVDVDQLKAQNVAAYVIFSDRSLLDMVNLKPQTRDQMRLVHGVGEAKMERYADIFVDVIRKHCEEKA